MSRIVRHNSGTGAQAFEAAFASARTLRSAALADVRERKKRRKARKRAVMPEGLTADQQRQWRMKEYLRIEDAKKFAENARFEAGLVKERLENGFHMRFGRMVCGRWREDVREKGRLRSDRFGLPGRMFVAACRKGGELRMSWDKANLGVESRSKLLSLDLPYFEGNKTFLSFWRIDLDHTWPSVEDFKADVHDMVGCRIPFAPHLVAGDELPDGRFARPHLYFLLPAGEAVWNDPENPKCKMSIVKFFEGVYYGIVDALKSLKADPGAPATTMRGKNPLSPLLLGFSMNDREFMSMSDWEGWVDTSLCRETLVRQRAADTAGVSVETSNETFTVVQKEAYRILREWYFNSDLRLRAPEGAIADNLHAALEPVAQELVARLPGRRRMSEKQVGLLVSRVASYAAGAFDPARLEKGIVRKALIHVVDGLKTVRERQQVAAEYASKEKAEKTLARLVDAWDSLAVETTGVTKSGLAREAKVSRTTVQARWADLQAVVEARKGRPVRCIDKRHPADTVEPILNITASQDVTPAPKATAVPEVGTAAARLTSEIRPQKAPALETVTRIALKPRVCTPATVVLAPSRPSFAPWQDDAPDFDDDDQDSLILAEQESFLAAVESCPNWEDPEDDPWFPDGEPESAIRHLRIT